MSTHPAALHCVEVLAEWTVAHPVEPPSTREVWRALLKRDCVPLLPPKATAASPELANRLGALPARLDLLPAEQLARFQRATQLHFEVFLSLSVDDAVEVSRLWTSFEESVGTSPETGLAISAGAVTWLEAQATQRPSRLLLAFGGEWQLVVFFGAGRAVASFQERRQTLVLGDRPGPR